MAPGLVVDKADYTRASHKYLPLPPDERAIRLLTLLPDDGTHQVKCELKTHKWDPETGFVWPTSESIKTNEVRLEDRRPAKFQGDPTNSAPQSVVYEALSYAWGSETDPQELIINDHILNVTRNLAEALSYLRNQHTTRTLWVDAVCINQSDTTEKGHQVQGMGWVYEHATQVIVWLGASFKGSDLAFDLALQIDHNFIDKGFDISTPTWDDILAVVEQLVSVEMRDAWIGLYMLLTSPSWWSRSWVVQELARAPIALFVCGKRSMDWHAVFVAILTTIHLGGITNGHPQMEVVINILDAVSPPGWSPEHRKRLHNLCEIRQSMNKAHREFLKQALNGVCLPCARDSYDRSTWYYAERVLNTIPMRICKFDHDKVYAILGLLPFSVYDGFVRIDYRQPFQEVYKQFLKGFVITSNSLDIISFAQHFDARDKLPSWTPDWRHTSRLQLLREDSRWKEEKETEKLRSLLIRESYNPRFSADLSILSVTGVHISIVKRSNLEMEVIPNLTILERPIQTSKTADIIGRYAHCSKNWNFPESIAQSFVILGYDTNELYARMFLKGNKEKTALEIVLKAVYLEKNYSVNLFPYPEELTLRDIYKVSSGEVQEWYAHIQAITESRTIIETDTLDIGLAPFWTQPGDILCQLVTSSFPFILRKLDDGNYRFIGECYMYGKMEGEYIVALGEALKSSEGLQTFNIV